MKTELLVFLWLLQSIVNIIMFVEIKRIGQSSDTNRVIIDIHNRRFESFMKYINFIDRHVDDLYDRIKKNNNSIDNH